MNKEEAKRRITNADLHEGNYKRFLDERTRRVKWLYNNSNKMLEVVSQKDAWAVVSKMQSEIDDLKQRLAKQSGNIPVKGFETWSNY